MPSDIVLDGPLRMGIVLILAGVSVAALTAAVVILVRDRRRQHADEPVGTALERRTLRRSKMRLGEDPIVAAMEFATDRERTRQAASEPGVSHAEREARPRRF